MLVRPAFRPQWHIVPVGEREVFLIAEGRQVVLNGRTYVELARQIDGARTTDAIVDALIETIPVTEIYLGLLRMERDGYIEERDAQVLPCGDGAWWSQHGIAQPDAVAALRTRTAGVRAVGGVDDAPLRRLLHESGVTVTAPETASVLLVVVDDYLHPDLDAIDRAARAAGQPWLPVKPLGLLPWLGPVFQPDGPCWSCLAQRIRVNRDTEEYVRTAIGAEAPFASRAASAGAAAAVFGLAVTEVARLLVTGATTIGDALLTLDAYNLAIDRHRVVRRPQCPACGDPDLLRDVRSVVPASRRKAHTEDGGHRVLSPEAALRRWQHHISPVSGVVRALTRLTDDDDPLHVYVSGANLALRSEDSRVLKRNLRGNACGKGVTDAQARMSAVGEAIERYSGVFRGEEPVERATMRDLGDRAVDPRTWTLYSDAQYAARADWNEEDRRLDTIPHPFHDDIETGWSPVWSMTHAESRLLPTSLLYYSTPSPFNSGCFVPESNGAAAGGTLEDAMLQGLMELVERDSVAIWWYNRLRQPAVDLDAAGDPWVARLREAYAARGRDIWMLDVTSDLGIPSFVAFSRRIDGHETEDIVFAPAAHLDPHIAMQRALAELNQMIPGVQPPPGKEAGYTYDDPEAVRWWSTATVAAQPWVLPDADAPASRLDGFAPVRHADLRDDILHVQRLLEARGLEVLALDQTRPDIDLPVVKMIVPGLRHFWARFAPGRLYDVPVSMGRLAAPTAEGALNPIPVFI